MKASQYLLANLRETPAEAEIISHQLMLRAGMIRKTAAGIYTWLPIGLRVLRKIENIIREEMDATGAQELLMPGVQPAELWRESTRWEQYGDELLRFQDRCQRDFCLAPTHEEIITDLIRREIKSYKQLPANFYQIQTKFRDEIRPRFGIMRAREFIMKDAYSFHLTNECLQQTYQQMYTTYNRIFERLGLKFRSVQADSGNIGGSTSHEFHVLADSGEDQIVFSKNSSYAANIDLATSPAPEGSRPPLTQTITKVNTPGQHSIEEISQFFKVAPEQCIKTLIVNGQEQPLIALIIRGDHEINKIKTEKNPLIAQPLKFASSEAIQQLLNCGPGSIGPVNINIPMLVDHSARHTVDFICGTNQDDYHFTGVNWGIDLPEPESVDIRNITKGEQAPDGSGELDIARGIEVGHIFQLGTKYSDLMKATCRDQNGDARTLTMGCYGIGVSRLVAAAIEQNHDNCGIIWNDAIAPFQIVLIPINMYKSQALRNKATDLYHKLQNAGFEVLFDDRKERPGVMFSDAELIGIPHRLTISEQGIKANSIEYRARSEDKNSDIALPEIIDFLKKRTALPDK